MLNKPIVDGEPDVTAHIFNPLTQEAGGGRSRVQGQPEWDLASKTNKPTRETLNWKEGTQKGH